MGVTQANYPTLNVGAVTLNFKVDMTKGSGTCDQLIVGSRGGTGKVNFGYNGGSTQLGITGQGNTTTGHQWQVIFFQDRTGDVSLIPPTGFRKNWQNKYLEIDN
jgi:hypothetical protein